MNFFDWLIVIVAAERITEIIVDSELIKPIRQYIKKITYKEDEPPTDGLKYALLSRLDYLVNCGYCVSVWVGLLLSAFVHIQAGLPIKPWLSWFIVGIFIHGMSNAFHVIYSRILKGRIITLDLMVNHTIKHEQDNIANLKNRELGNDEELENERQF